MKIYVVTFQDVVNQRRKVAVAFTKEEDAKKIVKEADSDNYLQYIGELEFMYEPCILFDSLDEFYKWNENNKKRMFK